MPCYKPMLAYPVSISCKTGKVQYKFGQRLSSAAELSEVREVDGKLYPVKALPCGQCIGCRLDYSKEWAIRCTLEMLDHCKQSCYFVTLTYDDEHLRFSEPEIVERLCVWPPSWASPEGKIVSTSYQKQSNMTLYPDDLTKFFKDLRRNQHYHFGSTFRFYACGEYGTISARPHYHALIFGLIHPEPDNRTWRKVRAGYTMYESKYLESIWRRGNVIIGTCTFESIGYVARYMLKKHKGDTSDFYETFNIIPEFSRMSRMPGIGSSYYKENAESFYRDDEIFIATEKRGIKVKPPRYFDDLASEEFPDMMAEIKDIRSEIALESMITKEFTSGRPIWKVLEDEQANRLRRTKILQKRSATE